MRFKYKIQSFEDILQLYLFQQNYQFYPIYFFQISPSNPFIEECIKKLFHQSSYYIIEEDDNESFELIPKIQKKDILEFSLSHSPLFNNKIELKETEWDMILIWEKEEIQTTYRFMEKYPQERKVYIYSHFTYEDLEILFWNREVQYTKIPVSITKKEFIEKWENEICKVDKIYSFGYHPLLSLPLLIRNESFQVCINQEPQYLLKSTFYFQYHLNSPLKEEDDEKKEEVFIKESSPIIIEEIIYIEEDLDEFKEDFQQEEVQYKELEVKDEPPLLILQEEEIHLQESLPSKMKVLKENKVNIEREYLFDITEKNIVGLTYLLCYQHDKENKIEKIWIQKNYLMLLNEANKMLYTFFRDWFHLVHPHYVKIDFYQNGTDIKTKLEVEKMLVFTGVDSQYQKMFKDILRVPNYYIEYKNYVIMDKNTTEKMDTPQKVILLKNTKEEVIYSGDKSILLDHRKYEQYKKMIPFSYMDILHREIELIKNSKKVYYEENSNRYSYNRILFDLFIKRVV